MGLSRVSICRTGPEESFPGLIGILRTGLNNCTWSVHQLNAAFISINLPAVDYSTTLYMLKLTFQTYQLGSVIGLVM
jgi:hypothetical protein